jgi:hypothetical protein
MEQATKYENEIQICLDHLNVDFMPLHDVYRAIFGFEKLVPTENEFSQTLDLIRILLTTEDVIFANKIGFDFSNQSISNIISFLTDKWKSGKYDEINYGVWLDKNNST